MATERQIDANRRNALRSTGPKTVAGINIAKRNSVKHGLSGAGLVLPEFLGREAGERARDLHSSLKPWDEWELWLCNVLGLDAVRLEDCVKRQAMRRCELARRAQLNWDDDRRADAALLAAGLDKKPEIGAQLRSTKHGCEFMIEQWTRLAAGLAKNGGWDAGGTSYALDLLGVPLKMRGQPTALDAPDGVKPLVHLKAFVQKEIADLAGAATGRLSELDAQRRYDAEIGQVGDDVELRRLQRYESQLRRWIDAVKKMFKKGRPGGSYLKLSDVTPPVHVPEDVRQRVEALRQAGPQTPEPEPAPDPTPHHVPEPVEDEEFEDVAAAPPAEAEVAPEPAADGLRDTA